MRLSSKSIHMEATLSVVAIVVSIIGLAGILRIVPITIDASDLLKLLISFGAGVLGGVGGYFYKRLISRKKISVFISHSMQDTDVARKLAESLRSDGFFVILPEERIAVGDSIIAKVKESIGESDSVVVLLSERGTNSKWVQKEVAIAREKRRPVYPVLLEGAQVPDNFKDIVHVRMGDSYEQAVKTLESALRPANP